MNAMTIDRRQSLGANRVIETAFVAACVVGLVFVAALFGILTRPIGFLAAFWPANALLLGLFVRKPHMATPVGWLSALVGFVVADLITGSTLMITLWLTAANLAGAFVGFNLFQRLTVEDRFLRRPLSVLYLFSICLASAVVAAIVGGGASQVLFHRDIVTGFGFWFSTELVNYIIILPVIFTFPRMADLRLSISWPTGWNSARTLLTDYGPLIALVLSIVAGAMIGGPGSIAFPVPALLWCALTYSLFSTSVLTLLLSVWLLIAISAGLFPLPFSSDHVHSVTSVRLGIMLLALGPMTAASINTARDELLRNLDRAVSYDFLTDALSRSAFMKRGQSLFAKLAPDRQPLTILMLDIDHFKRVNDQHGHAMGDRVLVEFTQRVTRVLREDDLLGRLGGEEFAIILPRMAREDAEAIAERIRAEIEMAEIELESGDALHVSVSIGLVHIIPTAEVSLEPALTVADAALYRAKAAGRNQVVCALS